MTSRMPPIAPPLSSTGCDDPAKRDLHAAVDADLRAEVVDRARTYEQVTAHEHAHGSARVFGVAHVDELGQLAHGLLALIA